MIEHDLSIAPLVYNRGMPFCSVAISDDTAWQ
jgi:hypothetical protein